MKSIILICAILFLAIYVSILSPLRLAAADSAKIRIGVYDTRAVCIAARNSDLFKKSVDELQKQMNEAKKSGDSKRIDQIKKHGKTLQTLRHMQAFSSMQVDDLLVAIKDQLPVIAQKSGVIAISNRLNYQSDSVNLVDITSELVAAYKPDANTQKTIDDLIKHKPITILDAMEIED